jgi:hypothetical protein
MNLFTRLGLLAAACALAACVRFAVPSIATDMGLDVWAVPELRRQLEQHRARWDVLHQKEQGAKRRIALKSVLAGQLIEGRTTLAETAARFRDIDATHPSSLEIVRETYPGRGDGECYCRNVIDHIRSRLHDDPSLADEVTARLEAELSDRLARPGDIELP